MSQTHCWKKIYCELKTVRAIIFQKYPVFFRFLFIIWKRARKYKKIINETHNYSKFQHNQANNKKTAIGVDCPLNWITKKLDGQVGQWRACGCASGAALLPWLLVVATEILLSLWCSCAETSRQLCSGRPMTFVSSRVTRKNNEHFLAVYEIWGNNLSWYSKLFQLVCRYFIGCLWRNF